MIKNNRPKLKVKMTNSDKGLEILGWILLAVIWVLTISKYSQLPETIPIHYNGLGEADGFGNKWNILTLPIVASILYVGMTILNKYPHVFNYPNNITEQNAMKKYKIATRLVRVLKLVVVIIFGLIVFRTLQNINGSADGLGIWFLPLTMALIFIPMAYFLIKMSNDKGDKSTGYNNVYKK
ncbi:DUF1648 domain-containing protein [Psychroflexus halocasei]|uniref:DUF1648 domain-containing protein n=1 Tax=Psychroflexus halocasei TaxID=908615 RepID=A0A1H4E2I9_9FLAO|nr:DUF1648 domain-containing protein [Psychroflexus halocasei]SEA78978.1 Protein of unknown function [Psychroflexus halocasei]